MVLFNDFIKKNCEQILYFSYENKNMIHRIAINFGINSKERIIRYNKIKSILEKNSEICSDDASIIINQFFRDVFLEKDLKTFVDVYCSATKLILKGFYFTNNQILELIELGIDSAIKLNEFVNEASKILTENDYEKEKQLIEILIERKIISTEDIKKVCEKITPNMEFYKKIIILYLFKPEQK